MTGTWYVSSLKMCNNCIGNGSTKEGTVRKAEMLGAIRNGTFIYSLINLSMF